MIISASRRTDIPAYYFEWFMNRIREGFVLVRNPMNFQQISKVSLSPDVVDGIVFWTKNPLPMLDKLEQLQDYSFYFQFTVTPYGQDLEPNIPDKNEAIIPAFRCLAEQIGSERVVWRYDPILLNAKYTMEYHIQVFEEMTRQLYKHTQKCTISFIDLYRKNTNRMQEFELINLTDEKLLELCKALAQIAQNYGLRIDTCAEKIDLQQLGIEHARCIDDRLLAKLLGWKLRVGKDKNQRQECGCVTGIDMGMYNTCRSGCRYCYANYSDKAVMTNFLKHNPTSPLLFGEIQAGDVVTERKGESHRERQLSLTDAFFGEAIKGEEI